MSRPSSRQRREHYTGPLKAADNRKITIRKTGSDPFFIAGAFLVLIGLVLYALSCLRVF